jgi:hypothetical protein
LEVAVPSEKALAALTQDDLFDSVLLPERFNLRDRERLLRNANRAAAEASLNIGRHRRQAAGWTARRLATRQGERE